MQKWTSVKPTKVGQPVVFLEDKLQLRHALGAKDAVEGRLVGAEASGAGLVKKLRVGLSASAIRLGCLVTTTVA